MYLTASMILHLNCSAMLNVEMYYIYYNPEKINNHMCYGNVLFKFIFQLIKKFFIPCTHSALSKGRNTYNKIQFTNQSNLEHEIKEMGGERKTGRCAGTCTQTHRPSQLLYTLLDTHNSAFQSTHHRLFSNAWSVGVWSSNRNKKLRSWAHTQTHLAGWLRHYRCICTHVYTHNKYICLVW